MKLSIIPLTTAALLILTGCAGETINAAEITLEVTADVTPELDADIDTPSPDPTLIYTGPTYSEDIQPILSQVCGACHGPGRTAGLNLTTYEGIMEGSYHGAVIVSGSPDDSELVKRQRSGHFRQLSEEELTLVIEWIAGGIPE